MIKQKIPHKWHEKPEVHDFVLYNNSKYQIVRTLDDLYVLKIVRFNKTLHRAKSLFCTKYEFTPVI